MEKRIIKGSIVDFLTEIEKHLRETLIEMDENDKDYPFYLGNYNVAVTLLAAHYGHQNIPFILNYEGVKKAFKESNAEFTKKVMDKAIDKAKDKYCKLKQLIDELLDDEDDEIDALYHDASEDELRKMGAFDNLNDDEDEDKDNNNHQVKLEDIFPELFEKLTKKDKKSPKKAEKTSKKE